MTTPKLGTGLVSAPTSSRRRGDRASERGSPLLNLLRSQVNVESSWATTCKYWGRIVDILCAWLNWDYSLPNCTTMCPSGAAINIKKVRIGGSPPINGTLHILNPHVLAVRNMNAKGGVSGQVTSIVWRKKINKIPVSQKKCFSNNYAYFAGKIVLHLHLTILIILTISDYILATFWLQSGYILKGI